jgi:hypothetical protein
MNTHHRVIVTALATVVGVQGLGIVA